MKREWLTEEESGRVFMCDRSFRANGTAIATNIAWQLQRTVGNCHQ